jgi:hypothetical protein
MDDEELAETFETRAGSLRAASQSVSDPEARLELLRIANMYEEQAQALRARAR